jgi:hypothetical protein
MKYLMPLVPVLSQYSASSARTRNKHRLGSVLPENNCQKCLVAKHPQCITSREPSLPRVLPDLVNLGLILDSLGMARNAQVFLTLLESSNNSVVLVGFCDFWAIHSAYCKISDAIAENCEADPLTQ